MGKMKLLIHTKTSMVHLLKFENGPVISFHTFFNGYNYLAVLGLKLTCASKRGHWRYRENIKKCDAYMCLWRNEHFIQWRIFMALVQDWGISSARLCYLWCISCSLCFYFSAKNIVSGYGLLTSHSGTHNSHAVNCFMTSAGLSISKW